MKPVLIVSELAPMMMKKKIKDDIKPRETQHLRNHLDIPFTPSVGKGGLSKMVRVPEGEYFFARHAHPCG